MSETRACPECNGALAADPRFRSWCPACNWNLGEPATATPSTRLGRWQRQLSLERSDALFRDLTASPAVLDRSRPPWALLGLATVVHLTSVAWIVGGLFLFLHRRNVFGGAIGLVLVLVGVSFLPRPARVDRKVTRFDRSQLPTTFALVDRIADHLETRRVHAIVLRADFNASVRSTTSGRILSLGLPLVRALAPAELTAVVGHQMARFVDGDPLRSWYVYGAHRTVLGWYQVLRMDRQVGQRGLDGGIGVLADLVARVLGWVFSWPVLGLLYAFQLSAWRGQQLAGYRADRLAGTLAGPAAMVGALSTLETAYAVDFAIQRAVMGDGSTSVWSAIAEQAADMPPLERERLRRVSAAPGRTTDTTHPPTAHRLVVLGTLPPRPGSVGLNDAGYAQVWAELEDHAGDVEERLYGRHGRTRPRHRRS